MQKCSDPSGFLENSTGAPHGEEDGHIALASNNSSNCYFLISNYSWGLCLGTWTSVRAQCLLLEVSHVCLPASSWVVLVWAACQGIHHDTYIILYAQ